MRPSRLPHAIQAMKISKKIKMLNFKPLKNIFLASVILAPLGIWKAVELAVDIINHILTK